MQYPVTLYIYIDVGTRGAGKFFANIDIIHAFKMAAETFL